MQMEKLEHFAVDDRNIVVGLVRKLLKSVQHISDFKI